jgi:hypothetical protein
MLRALKLLRTKPNQFTTALIHSYQSIPIYFFAFSAFPAIFHNFTNLENIEFAASFMMNLIEFDCPSNLLTPLFLSLLFSTFSFADALWTHLHKLLCAKRTITEAEAIRNLCTSIEVCAPLVALPIYQLIQILLARYPTLCCDATIRYL